ncbi:hypothetical protein PR048_027768 [Dryococelus australis]|uniref:Uncharacterized protein n=1 Tax=Dryococelus australis TaxID=614101 RepID=A0ABQ9GHH4_9NEOP|nr:hypothetical protein PR048_027768 [Dryococelus australis]
MVLNQLPYSYQVLWTGRTYNDLVAFREGLLAFDQIYSLQRTHGGREGEKAAPVERAPPLYQGHPQQQFRGNGGHDQHPRLQSYQVDYYEPYHIHQYSSQRTGQQAFRD